MTSKIREFRGYRRLKFTAAEQQAIRNAERGFVYRPGEIAQNRPTPQPPVRQRCAYRHCRYPRTAAYPLLTAHLSHSFSFEAANSTAGTTAAAATYIEFGYCSVSG
jgi:hypothetical protein